MMEKDSALVKIQANIRGGNNDLASIQILELANHFSDDPFTLLTCASLLRTIGNNEQSKDVVKKIPVAVEQRKGSELEVARGLRGIMFPKEALMILSNLDVNDDISREKVKILFDMHLYPEAIEEYGSINEPNIFDSILMISSLSALKKHDEALLWIKEVLLESPNDLEVMRCYCSVLVASGKDKDAEKYVKEVLKKDKSSADANALSAYFLWIEGRSTSAGAYASKAVKADPTNLLGMEVLAYSLVDKGKVNEARIVAGAINEQDPGNPAVLRILEMCRS